MPFAPGLHSSIEVSAYLQPKPKKSQIYTEHFRWFRAFALQANFSKRKCAQIARSRASPRLLSRNRYAYLCRPRQGQPPQNQQISPRQFRKSIENLSLQPIALMAAQSAHLGIGLQRAGTQRSVPAINGSLRPSSGVQAAARAIPTQFRGADASLSRCAGIRRPRNLSSPVIAASTYENGYGSVGTPDDQLDSPGADSASVLASNRPTATQRTVQVPPPVTAPGAAPVYVGATSVRQCGCFAQGVAIIACLDAMR